MKIKPFQAVLVDAFRASKTELIHFESGRAMRDKFNETLDAAKAVSYNRNAFWDTGWPRIEEVFLHGTPVARVSFHRSSYQREGRYYAVVEVIAPLDAAADRRLTRANNRNSNDQYMRARARVLAALKSGQTVSYTPGHDGGTFSLGSDRKVAAIRTLWALGLSDAWERLYQVQNGWKYANYPIPFSLWDEPISGRPGSLEWEMTAG